MQRILNNADDIVDECTQGFVKAHSDIVSFTENPRVVKAKEIASHKVGVITGGGSGHKPACRICRRRTLRCGCHRGNLFLTDSKCFLRCCSGCGSGKRCRLPVW